MKHEETKLKRCPFCAAARCACIMESAGPGARRGEPTSITSSLESIITGLAGLRDRAIRHEAACLSDAVKERHGRP